MQTEMPYIEVALQRSENFISVICYAIMKVKKLAEGKCIYQNDMGGK